MDKKEKMDKQEEELKVQNESEETKTSDEKIEEQEVPQSEEQKLADELQKAKEMIEEQKDKYLRLSAEFDNYRKRTMKEKAELILNGGEKSISSILPIVDDLERALKTIEFFVENCIEESGLPNGIYNVDKEEYVYWWTGILFPFQYSRDREELEGYLGSQVVSSLMRIAEKLGENKGNYCRSMVDTMYYLMRCWQLEKKCGREHPNWYNAVEKFCDKMLEMQNENGSWNRGYTMEGKPLTEP